MRLGLSLGLGAYRPLGEVIERLRSLSLSNASVLESIAQSATVGTVQAMREGSTLEIVDTAGDRFTLSGGDIVRGATALDYETATSHQITLRETNAAYDPSTRDTTLTITVSNVFEQPALNSLALSVAEVMQGQAVTITITGATAGSTISGTVPDGLTLNSAARTITGTPPTVGDYTFSLTETLADSPNSPRSNSVSLAVAAPDTTPDAPVITQASAEGENPLLLNVDWGDDNLIPPDEFDNAVDQVVHRHRVNGGAWVTDDPIPVDFAFIADHLVDGEPIVWPDYAAASPFPAGSTVGRMVGIIRDGSTVWSNEVSDEMAAAVAAAWTPEPAPAGQNIGYGSAVATFAGIHFGEGLGVITVTSKDRRVTAMTVGGVAASRVVEADATPKASNTSMWKVPVAADGNHDVVITCNLAIPTIAISTGTLAGINPVPAATAAMPYSFAPDPQSLGPFTYVDGGVILAAFGSEAGENNPNWTNGDEEADVGVGGNTRHTSASRTSTGTMSVTNFNYAGSQGVAAVWEPA